MATLPPMAIEEINPAVLHIIAASSGLLNAWVLACLAGAVYHYRVFNLLLG